MNAPRHVSHDETVVEMLKADPNFANEYLAAALEEAELPGGQTALLAALRHIAEAPASGMLWKTRPKRQPAL
jgi:DNA-binding phage protein